MVISVNKVFLICVNNRDTLANLMVLEMVDFDAISGTDELVSCHATMDCHQKIIKFEVPGKPLLIFLGDSCLDPTSLVFFS